MLRLNGYIPVFLNPETILREVIAMSRAAFTTPRVSCIVTVLPGLLLIHPSIAEVYAHLKGPKTETSSG